MLEVIPTELISTIINFVDYESYMKLFGMNKFFYKMLTTNAVRYKEINSNRCKQHHIMFCLNTLEKIILTEDDSITDNTLRNLPLIKYLILSKNTKITDAGLQYIPLITNLNLRSNTNITDNGLQYIPLVKNLNLGRNTNITDVGLQYIFLV